MAIIKCKMCGGDLNLIEGASTAECEFCGSVQTIPNLDDEKKLVQFERAERLRKQCEFDKAAGIYETIVADFRQEAEAYWGLVLCKYGIEYVDDPATGKKIPTCHRSSFESIMEDSDFEQALENADGSARKVYRDEAKAIEEIRKGIIAVSANEEPYDIFICYKETSETGDRTLDSVLAQDVYDALTDKGYRVFFSRVTLEDKLGMEYEPYIFAALNSAKIMLAFGTDYEYFNAVWVKNEWSRFLKLMAKDKEKHLIPCFKGIDAYDMPKEFARLQAQDLGKVGAIQDLLRGIEKILPRQTAQSAVVQERVVVGGGGDNKIASLLDRGNMALEDGDWAKADSFFEDVLNNDSKNAQAYLGKALAMEKCRTIDAFVRKRKDASQNVRGKELVLQPNHAHINGMIERLSLPGYTLQSEIRKFYDFDLRYHSDVEERMQQYRTEEAYWAEHKLLSRAEKFAVGAVAENLQREKKALLAVLSDRVKEAENAEAAAKADVQTRYEAHLRKADEQAEKLYNEGLASKEKYYKYLLQIAKTSSNVGELTKTAEKFKALGDYQDSKSLAEHCLKRADEERANLAAEAEQRRLLANKRAKERNKKLAIFAIFAGIIAVLITAVVILYNTFVLPPKHYDKAKQYLDEGKIAEAAIYFGKAGNYEDATEKSRELWDQIAKRDTIHVDYDTAVALKADGTVLVAGNSEGDVSGWKDCIAVTNSGDTIIALKADGTVYNTTAGKTDKWKNIVAISADFHYLGLKTDGTVVATGSNYYGQTRVSNWSDIVAIAVGGHHSVGLRSDGTVVAVGDTSEGQCNVGGWTDIVAIAAGYDYTVGLKADGTVVATDYTGTENYGQCNVGGWTDIVAIDAGGYRTVGLRADGTVVSTYYAQYPNASDVEHMTGIVAIDASSSDTLALKMDGTVDSAGSTGKAAIKSWTDIMLPYMSNEKAEAFKNAVANRQRLQALENTMQTSILEAYATAMELKNDGVKSEIIQICEDYYPYCGTFAVSGPNYPTIQSDFCWDGTAVYWKCKHEIFGVRFNEEIKMFFTEPAPVEQMCVTEMFATTQGNIRFFDGKIEYVLGYYANASQDRDGNYVEKDDYTEADKYLLIKQK